MSQKVLSDTTVNHKSYSNIYIYCNSLQSIAQYKENSEIEGLRILQVARRVVAAWRTGGDARAVPKQGPVWVLGWSKGLGDSGV